MDTVCCARLLFLAVRIVHTMLRPKMLPARFVLMALSWLTQYVTCALRTAENVSILHSAPFVTQDSPPISQLESANLLPLTVYTLPILPFALLASKATTKIKILAFLARPPTADYVQPLLLPKSVVLAGFVILVTIYSIKFAGPALIIAWLVPTASNVRLAWSNTTVTKMVFVSCVLLAA